MKCMNYLIIYYQQSKIAKVNRMECLLFSIISSINKSQGQNFLTTVFLTNKTSSKIYF